MNRAVAFNDKCAQCLTYASATQIVLGVDGPVRFTSNGRQRLAALAASVRRLEGQVPTMNAAQLHAAVTAVKAELVAILETELVVKTKEQDEVEAEDPFTTVAPAADTAANAKAASTASTATTSSTPVSGTAASGTATTSTSTSTQA